MDCPPLPNRLSFWVHLVGAWNLTPCSTVILFLLDLFQSSSFSNQMWFLLLQWAACLHPPLFTPAANIENDNDITDAPKHLFFITVAPPCTDSRLSIPADARLRFAQAATLPRSPHWALDFCHQGRLFHRCSCTGGILACLARITTSPFGISATNSISQIDRMSLWLSKHDNRNLQLRMCHRCSIPCPP